MTSILGIDLSSFQLDGALLIDDQPPVLRRERLGTSKEPLIERCRRVWPAVDRLTRMSTGRGKVHHYAGGFYGRPDWIVLESAYGHGAHALHLTTGAIIASCPAESQIATISSGDWRRAIGAKNTKADGHRVVVDLLYDQMGNDWIDALDEHAKDAAGIALAWRRILAQHEAAA